MSEQHRVRLSASPRRTSKIRLAVLAVLLAGVGCDITGPDANVSGVWEARFDFPQANDSLFLVLRQEGSTVKGYGFLSTPVSVVPNARPLWVFNSFGLGGMVTGIAADLTLDFASNNSRLSGLSTGNELTAVVDAGNGGKFSVRLHRSHPASDEVAGTWALTSTTSGGANATADTIIVGADGRTWEHREGPLGRFVRPTMLAMWKRRGDWLVLHYQVPRQMSIGVDSLRLTSGELQRPYNGATEHFTRVSTAATIP